MSTTNLIGHEPDMVYLPQGGLGGASFVDHDFLQHVSPLAVGALRGNILL